ncbi:S-layer homology domain-containing protein [Phosphitispora sp. TUW77]|uniref:S-layer homology domain-containing protein n=1 Tax=Phosphitispora sp. TUW77 TaxID=3152361 RepID=UPI003AB490C3
MRKFKRMIALVTVALFVLAFAAPAGAATFSDVSGTSSDSIYRLNALGIIDGYPDGTFKPANSITRAEFAKIAMSAAGNASSADFLKDAASKFSDVKPGQWFTGWVNLAANLGYIQGYPDGTFKPQSNITYAECVTILVRLLGYSDKLPGEWPTEYLVKAAELGVTDDVSFSANGAANRGDIAMMTSETLDQNLVVWDKDVDDFAFKRDADDNVYTLLADKFDGAVYDEDDYFIADWEMNADHQIVLEVTGTINPFTGEEVEGGYTGYLTLAEDCVVDGGRVVTTMSGNRINFIYNEDDEEVTYVDIVSTALSSGNVEMDGEKLKIDGVSYRFADDAYNGYVAEPAGEYNYQYKTYFDEDNRIYLNARINEPNKPHIIDEIDSDLTMEYLDGGSVDLDQDDILVIRNYQYVSVDDLQPGDVAYVFEDEYGCDVFVDAYAPGFRYSTTAKFNAAMETTGDDVFDQVKVGGQKYDLISAAAMSTDDGDEWSDVADGDETFFDDVYDENVFIVLDRSMDICLIVTDADSESNTIYGVVDKVLDTDLDDFITSIKIMKTDGATVTYDVDTADMELTYDSVGTTFSAVDAVFDGAAVKFQLNDSGDIDDLEVLDDQANSITDGSEDLNKLYIDGSWYYTNSDTVVLNAPTDEDPDVVSTSNLLSDAESNTINCWVKLDGNKVELVMIVGDTVEGAADDMAMVIDDYIYDGDTWVTVDIRGTVEDYEVSSGTPATDELFDYSMSGSKIVLGTATDATVDYDVYGVVTDVDAANDALEVNDTWYEVDADSYIYDMTGSDPVYVDGIDGIDEDDCIFVIEVTGDDDRKGVADVILIVDEDDYTECDFEAGYPEV